MGEIIMLDKIQANRLSELGFKYTERNIDGKIAYVFIQTKELMKELSLNFEQDSFFIGKYVCL